MNAATVDRDGGTPDRASAQRDRILNAANRCFIEHGFHAASMASIADVADISAGLIYRYFDSKNAIILAIIERQLAEKRADIASLQPGVDFAERIGELVARWRVCDARAMSPALFLEMSALGTRDPQIGAALCASDRLTRGDLAAWLMQRAERSGQTLSESDALNRAFALQCLVEGLALRVVREPDIADAQVAHVMAQMLPTILP
ncbi:MAG TPA: TetR/AcrR family transcriptional regulator [Patescibacteria group bacterium]|nr:TetR/AcrR family transcriptional regulator [Patescibacteria group bacterium]